MKQGSGTSSHSAQKREPIANAISVKAVSQIGMAMGNHATDIRGVLPNPAKDLHKGRGFEAPRDAGRTIHHGGSQRRHD